MSELPLSYQETIGKREVGALVDEARRTIHEQNMQRSQSPYRSSPNADFADQHSQYASVSARNIQIGTASIGGQGGGGIEPYRPEQAQFL